MITLTISKLRALHPCDLDSRLALFGKRKSMTAAQAFAAGASISDMCWVAQKLGHKNLLVRFGLKCAQAVPHLNSDPRVKAALDATQAYLDNPCEITQYAAAAADAAAYAVVLEQQKQFFIECCE